MKSVNAFCERIKNADAASKNGQENDVFRAFLPSERYIIDFADDFTTEGWLQFDTDQDAEYFGVWVNPSTLQTLTYAEGDWTLVCCQDVEHYNAEVRDAINFYGEGYVAKGFDPANNSMTIWVQDREEFLIK